MHLFILGVSSFCVYVPFLVASHSDLRFIIVLIWKILHTDRRIAFSQKYVCVYKSCDFMRALDDDNDRFSLTTTSPTRFVSFRLFIT